MATTDFAWAEQSGGIEHGRQSPRGPPSQRPADGHGRLPGAALPQRRARPGPQLAAGEEWHARARTCRQLPLFSARPLLCGPRSPSHATPLCRTQEERLAGLFGTGRSGSAGEPRRPPAARRPGPAPPLRCTPAAVRLMLRQRPMQGWQQPLEPLQHAHALRGSREHSRPAAQRADCHGHTLLLPAPAPIHTPTRRAPPPTLVTVQGPPALRACWGAGGSRTK